MHHGQGSSQRNTAQCKELKLESFQSGVFITVTLENPPDGTFENYSFV